MKKRKVRQKKSKPKSRAKKNEFGSLKKIAFSKNAIHKGDVLLVAAPNLS